MILDSDSLIAEWKMRHYLEPLRSDATFRRYDAIDLDAYILRRLDAWYDNLLDTAPPRQLVPHEIAADLNLVSRCGRRAVYSLPAGCRRILSVAATPAGPGALIAAEGSPLALRQECPFSCGGPAAPVAVVSPGRIAIFGIPLSQELPHSVMAILTPPEGTYELQPSALDTLNTI